MIAELLGDSENKLTGKELSKLTGLTMREVVRRIEIERQGGAPICASSGAKDCGYYIGNADETDGQCRFLSARVKSLQLTLRAMRATAKRLHREEGG